MRLSGFLSVLFVVILVLPGATFGKELKIGVINLNQVFENYEKRKELEDDFKDVRAKAEDILKEKQDELLSLREETQLLEMGSAARKEKEAELEKKLLYLQLEEEVARKNLGVKEKEFYEELYKDISIEAEEIGKAEGFDLVLKKEVIEPKSADLLELRLKIGIGTVLYFSNAIDITEKVVKGLNKRYSRR